MFICKWALKKGKILNVESETIEKNSVAKVYLWISE